MDRFEYLPRFQSLYSIIYGYIIINYVLQVAVLAPLALLLVLEARCAHFVIAHFNYCVLWSSASLAPTQHIYKLVSEIIVIAMGVVPMSR